MKCSRRSSRLGFECGADNPILEKFIVMKPWRGQDPHKVIAPVKKKEKKLYVYIHKFFSCFTILKFKGNFGYRNHELFDKNGEVMNEEIYFTYI